MGAGIENAIFLHKRSYPQAPPCQTVAVPFPVSAAGGAADRAVKAGAGVKDGLPVLDAGEEAAHAAVGSENPVDRQLLLPGQTAVFADEQVADAAVRGQRPARILRVVTNRGDRRVGRQIHLRPAPGVAAIVAEIDARRHRHVECTGQHNTCIDRRYVQADDAVREGYKPRLGQNLAAGRHEQKRRHDQDQQHPARRRSIREFWSATL